MFQSWSLRNLSLVYLCAVFLGIFIESESARQSRTIQSRVECSAE